MEGDRQVWTTYLLYGLDSTRKTSSRVTLSSLTHPCSGLRLSHRAPPCLSPSLIFRALGTATTLVWQLPEALVEVAEGKGQKARQMGRRGVGVVWILFSQEQTAGWLLLGLPAPGSQGSSQGLVFRATTSLGIVP